MKLGQDFKAFLLRGNVVDLAIAVVIGAAFGAVITALVSDLFTPLIAAITGSPDFSRLTFDVNGSTFRYGHIVNAVIAFLVIAAAIFFLVIVPLHALVARSHKSEEAPAEPMTRKCGECLSVIPLEAKRCMYCTSPVDAASPGTVGASTP
jgi:large conductance mechanosensitive channel